MLRPILRYCVRYCIYLQDIMEAVKCELVEVAKEEMKKAGEELNVSRISIMTGVNRREVTRIYREERVIEEPLGFLSRVMGQWQTDERYTTKAGKARVLSVGGPDSEFRDLVYSVSKDLNPGTVLLELERVGAVKRVAHGLRLELGTYVPTGDTAQGITLLGADAADLINCVTENIFSPPEVPNLHAKTEYDNVEPEALPQIRQWLFNEGSSFHHKIRSYLSQYDRDVAPSYTKGRRGVRVAVRTFSFVDK